MDTKPGTDYHSPPVKDFNQRMQGQPKIELSEHALIAEAQQETGLRRFGDESFLAALRRLLDAIEQEANLNPFGRRVAKSRTVASLKNRLWANACFEAHPEILQRKIVAPVIIVGPHRSGTTRLQHMLACDARLRHLQAWEGINPAPRTADVVLDKTTRYEEARALLDHRKDVYPEGHAAHPMHADWPEEEMLLMNHSFSGFSALGLYTIPSYYTWFIQDDKTAAYRYMADLMRLISWSKGEPENKRWILKNPQHMLNLDTLLKVFPDAKLVFPHRDPIKTVGSMLSLAWRFAVQHTNASCRAQIRNTWLDFCVQAASRCIQIRERTPAAQQLDVYYEETNRDWRAVMQCIYRFIDLPFTPAVEQKMETWLIESQRERSHSSNHLYDVTDFGITDQQVDATMMFVRKRYAIPYESHAPW